MSNRQVLSLRFLLALFPLFWLLSACQPAERRAREMPESLNAFVYAHTAGLQTKHAPIRIRFATQVVDESDQLPDPSLLSLYPKAEGKLSWEDGQTLRFEPSTPLESGRVYVVSVRLDQLFDNLPPDAQTYEFDFRTRDQHFRVDAEALYAPQPKETAKQTLRGTITTADAADNEQVEALLTARQASRKLPIRWEHAPDALRHTFYIESVARTDKEGQLDLRWDGSPLGLDYRGQQTIDIPALNEFKVTALRVVEGEDPHLSLHFSDPLATDQSLDGLLRLASDANIRLLIDGQQVRIYPQEPLSGEQTVLVAAGLRNLAGTALPRAARWTAEMPGQAPQLRLRGQGVILPAGARQLFPFEAVGLEAVEVEVFKIYHNNILSFLQTNELQGNADLYRLGRVVMRKKIDLDQLGRDPSRNDWQRYALDLQSLFKQDKDAIYQLRIGFRPEYTSLACHAANGQELPLSPAYSEQGNEETDSFMEQWYGINGYYDGYEWWQREDPCYPAYYNSDRFVQRNILSSDFGIISKGSSDGRSFWTVVTSLQTAAPVGGVKLTYYDYQLQPLGEGLTDRNGMAQLALARRPFVVVAEKGGQKGYLRVMEGESLSLSQFDAGGAALAAGRKGFFYGERGVWRPGDSVFLNFVLEDKLQELPAGFPIQFELQDARGQLRERRIIGTSTGRTYALHFATRPDDPTGSWLARVKAGTSVFEKTLRIETIKPNRIRIDLSFPKSGEGLSAVLSAQWLHGATAAGLPARVEAVLREDPAPFSGYTSYRFADPARKIDSEPLLLFDGQLDQQGKARMQLDISETQMAAGKLSARISTRVYEPGGDFSIQYISQPYHPFSFYTGLEMPMDRYGEKRVNTGQSVPVKVVSLRSDGRAAPGRKLLLGVYRLDWNWWWEEDHTAVAQFNSSTHYNAVSSAELQTDANGKAVWKPGLQEAGRYLLRICDSESGHCSGDYITVGDPYFGDDERRPVEAVMLPFAADKTTYQPGQKARLSIPAARKGRLLITLENGAGVLQSHWLDAQAGDNSFTFTVTPEMAPTVYAHAIYIQAHANTDQQLPMRLYGLIPLSVEDPGTRLQPSLRMASVLRSDTETAITVSEQQGREMNYTLAIVDEGLLGLTNFRTPDPWGHFFAREALGVRTWDLFDLVLGAQHGRMARVLSIGGDAAALNLPDADKANRFKPVVVHLGPYKLNRGSKQVHRIRLPNYNGAVRVMVVAEQAGAYGKAEKQVSVRNPLMVQASLPRVLSPGEEISLPVTLFANEASIREASVRVEESSGLVRVAGAASQRVSFDRPSDKLVYFRLQVGKNSGVARFTVTAEGNGERVVSKVEIQVRNPSPLLQKVVTHTLNPGEEVSIPYAWMGSRGSRKATLEVASLPSLNLSKQLNYLLQYPFGCIEQTVSGGFPLLYVSRLQSVTPADKKRYDQRLATVVARLPQYQLSDGSFGYWPGAQAADHWATSYAGHFMLAAQSMGYQVPASLINRWLSYQQSTARKWDPSLTNSGFVSQEQYELDQAYRLYTLALARKAELGAMNQLRVQPALGVAARWRLAAAYALAGQATLARSMVRQLSTQPAAYRELSYTYGSDVRDQALILETLVLLKDDAKASALVQRLARTVGNSDWLSTQDLGFALLSIGQYMGDAPAGGQLSLRYQDGGRPAVDAGADKPVLLVQLSDPANDQRRILYCKNTGKQKVFISIITEGQPLINESRPAASQLNMQLRYTDTSGNPVAHKRLARGSRFVAEVRISQAANTGIDYPELALQHIFPAGWEISNARLDESSEQNESPFDYRDIKDDGVFTFFDLPKGGNRIYRISLTATYPGRYYLPPVSCSAMYDQRIYANTAGEWIEVY